MQRVLVILVVILLVTTSLGVGALSAHWPFWRRAWSWHAADGGWPSLQSGPDAIVRGGAAPPVIDEPGPDLERFARDTAATLLLRARDGRVEAWSAAGGSPQVQVDGRGLTPLLLAPLFARLDHEHPGLLDRPLGAFIEAWRQDQRGALTPRSLLAEVGEGILAPPTRHPLNPFRATARLASGPDFHRAALAVFDPAVPAPVDAHRAAAAQLLAVIASAVTARPFAEAMEQHLWSGMASQEARLLLDHRRGAAAAHCCLRASATDWLRLGEQLALALPGHAAASHVFRTPGRALALGAEGSAVFWVGDGDPPSGLENLLPAAHSTGSRRVDQAH